MPLSRSPFPIIVNASPCNFCNLFMQLLVEKGGVTSGEFKNELVEREELLSVLGEFNFNGVNEV